MYGSTQNDQITEYRGVEDCFSYLGTTYFVHVLQQSRLSKGNWIVYSQKFKSFTSLFVTIHIVPYFFFSMKIVFLTYQYYYYMGQTCRISDESIFKAWIARDVLGTQWVVCCWLKQKSNNGMETSLKVCLFLG